MSIYDKPVRLLMQDMVNDLDLAKGQVLTKAQALLWFRTNYPKVKDGTITAHLIRMSTNAPSRVHYRANPSGEDDLLYQIDGKRFRLYDSQNDPPAIYEKREDKLEDEETDIVEFEHPTEFAYERDLKHFLVKNLHLLEHGLQLYEEEEITGIEFPVGGRFIDILAVDTSGNYVVVELKVSRGYDRVIGQLLRYMAWIEKYHAESPQEVRGIVVAREISEDLLLAASKLNDVALFEYELSVTLQKVSR